MTAELADCFRTKREGVDAVLAAVELAAAAIPVHVWQTNGRFVTPSEAPQKTLLRRPPTGTAGHVRRTACSRGTVPVNRHRHDDDGPDPSD